MLRFLLRPLYRINTAARWALLSHLLWWLGDTVGDTFVSVYTVRLTATLADAAWFQMWKWGSVPAGFLLGAATARRFGGVATYRLGVGGYALFYTLVLWMGESILPWRVPLGILWGLAMGYYWLGWQLVFLDLTKDKERDAMLSLVGMSLFTSQLLGPTLAGFYLGHSGRLSAYGPLFAVVAGLLFLSGLVTWRLRTAPLGQGSGFFHLLKIKWKPEWKASLASFYFQGFTAVMTLFLAPLLAYKAFGNEKGTGAFAGTLALVGLVMSYVAGHVLRPHNRRRSMFWAALGVSLSTCLLLVDITYATLMAYGVLSALIRPFFGPPFFATHQRLITDSRELARHRADWLALRDFPIAFGRVSAALLIIFFLKDLSAQGIRALALILIAAPLINYWLMAPYVVAKGGEFPREDLV